MRTIKLLCGIGLVVSLTFSPLFAQQVPVIEKTLSNGMKLLMVERHDDPAVAGGWVAHVGSSNTNAPASRALRTCSST